MTNSNPTWTEIQPGDTADADIIMDNFLYLRNLVTANGQSIANKETISNKNAAGGYCGLDNTGQVPNARLSTFKQGIDSQISILSSQISSISGQITSLNDNKLSATKGHNGHFGYVKFSNGLIVQWGRENSGGHSYNHKYSLATNFATVNYKVVANLFNTNDSDRVFFVIKEQQKSYFYARAQGVENGSGGTTACQWIAIGY